MIHNTELLACAIFFQFPGGSEESEGGGDEEHDETV
jgi:hypothetical protein